MRNLSKDFEDLLHKEFKVIATIGLAECDHDFQSLKQQLEKIKKPYFEPDERIVFIHAETEYYVYDDRPGLTMINLFNLLTELDIPLCFTLLITNHWQLNSLGIPNIFCSFQKVIVDEPSNDIVDLDLNVDAIAHHMICLNGSSRPHRTALVSVLKAKNLIERNLISYSSV